MNNQFAALLVKYVSSKKISNSKTVQNFIETHTPSEYNGLPKTITPEIKAFSNEFIKKGLKSKDPQLTEFVTENAIETETVAFVPVKTSFERGEY